ncbi:hypothetical protein HU200_038652 [Digitaria exilis]|uniref:Uncharacterized protein n=1 Tax=Digitaria exilis TaxID=1010633 RepID=A0A835B8Z9_9POAL|nr:hypothetical protein HU200_038652 [Digitaria exilis]
MDDTDEDARPSLIRFGRCSKYGIRGRFPAAADERGDGTSVPKFNTNTDDRISQLGHATSNDELARMMAEADTGGFISLDEFAALNAPPPSSIAPSGARQGIDQNGIRLISFGASRSSSSIDKRPTRGAASVGTWTPAGRRTTP